MTDREHTEPTLAEVVVESSVDGLATLDREGRYTMWNRAMERFSGKRKEEVLGRPAFEVFPFLRDLGLDVAVTRALAGESVASEGIEQVEPDGTRKVYDRLYLPLRKGDGEIMGVVAIVRDASARYAALDALKESETKLRLAVEAGEVGLWSWDPATNAVAWEDAMCAIFGVSPADAPKTREAYLAFIHPDDRADSARRIARGVEEREWSDEYRIVRPDGTVRWVMSKARFLRVEGHELVLGALFDVTGRRQRDEQRRAAQKLETIGQLTAGIAHNFNNILMGLLPNLELAARRAPDELAPLLRGAERSAQRAADVVRQLMTYAGSRRKAVHRVESVGEIVTRTVAFSRTTFDARIAIDLRCDSAAAAVVDATQIEQALLNLLINARDALSDPAKLSPRIAVEVETVPEGAAELEGRAGAWVRVRVEDNGVGMSPETVQRIYEPFFTTKEAGKGTGLGLATTHGILRDHAGFIACRSALGRGSTFFLYLPRAATDAAVARDSSIGEHPPMSTGTRARSTVLVVDDEAPVRKVIGLLLEDAGFDVKTAASGDDALRIVGELQSTGRIALVLLDVSMPGMPGPLVRRRFRELLPEVPVIYLTGHDYEALDGDVVLQKPMTTQRLLAALDAALATKAASRSA